MALSEEIKRKIKAVDNARKMIYSTDITTQEGQERIAKIYSETMQQISSPVCPVCHYIVVDNKCQCNDK